MKTYQKWLCENVNAVEQFIQAVVTNPQDKNLRLIMADALEEVGDTQSSQLLREDVFSASLLAQTEHDEEPDDPDIEALAHLEVIEREHNAPFGDVAAFMRRVINEYHLRHFNGGHNHLTRERSHLEVMTSETEPHSEIVMGPNGYEEVDMHITYGLTIGGTTTGEMSSKLTPLVAWMLWLSAGV